MTRDPWSELEPPNSELALRGRRVDSAGKWGFFWARLIDGSCALALRVEGVIPTDLRLPSFRGMAGEFFSGSNNRWLVFRLTDWTYREIFYSLCMNIVAAASRAETEPQAVAAAVGRTWSWHHLVRGGRDARLTEEEQKGLIGEIVFVESYLLKALPPAKAIAAWVGPLNAPKDFEIGRTCIEVKARRAGAAPFVAISSAEQLDDSGIDTLLLLVVELDADRAGEQVDPLNLTTVVERLRLRIAASAPDVLMLLEERFAAAGYSDAHDYSDCPWLIGSQHVFEVREGFPRLVPRGIHPAVNRVRYRVGLAALEEFRVDATTLSERIKGAADVQ